MKAAVLLALGLLAASPATAGDIYGPDGRYKGSFERHGDAIERYDADGAYTGRAERRGDGFDVFGKDGDFRGRIDGEDGQ